MIVGVADTHAALWYLFDDRRLSASAAAFIEQAAAAREGIAVSTISLAETVYLVEKGRLPEGAYLELRRALNDSNHVFKQVPITIPIVGSMRSVSRDEVPDMPDRLIAATAVHFGVPVISCDGRIRMSSIETLW